ncbi:MAG: glycosyltransferase family 2 protein [Methylacidiphilales bacterium]|nr:glycosyltransferase family 2 protein [Candidatus Methylacidiphilales bacterium]
MCVVVPGLNEGDNLSFLCQELTRVLGGSSWTLEIIFVDDGSSDKTIQVCRQLHGTNSNFQYISLSRNFGHQRALTAGLDAASGDAVVVIDADLQDPPEVVLEMIHLWEEGVDVVYGQRQSREGETFFKKATAKLFYRCLRLLSGTSIPEDTGDFRLMDIRVVEELRKLREQGRFLRGLVSWLGFEQRPVFYTRRPRVGGTTKYSFLRMLHFGWDGITAFSSIPLRLATLTGVALSFLAFLMTIYYIFCKIYYNDFVRGWASLMVAILAVGGVQLLFIGLVGEYLAKAFEELKERPLYIVRESSLPLVRDAPSPPK